MAKRFSLDYPIECLRGRKRPSRHELLKALADRCAYLVVKLEEQSLSQKPTSHLVLELAATSLAARALEREFAEADRQATMLAAREEGSR